MSVTRLRKLVQLGLVLTAAVTGWRYAQGLSLTSVEKYCPFGGAATGYSLATEQRFSCATGELNLTLMVALLLLVLLTRKSFCSWLCPVGTVSEWLGRISGRLRGGKTWGGSRNIHGLVAPSGKAARRLRWLRMPVLAAVLYFTFRTAELIFRPFCPYYVMFSFHGHEVAWWSYWLLAVLVVGAVVIPMIWCRYLCPLGGLIWPFSRVGLLRLRRDAGKCTGCGACDEVCPHSLRVAEGRDLCSGECTLCLECRDACPTEGALELGLPGRKGAGVPGWVVPALMVALVAAGVLGGKWISLPSYAREYPGKATSGRVQAVEFKVRGVMCVDTAKRAATVFDGTQGVRFFTAYASRNLVRVEYDPSLIDVAMLQRLLEGPVHDQASDQFVFHVFEVLEIDGRQTTPAKPGNKQQKGESR